MLLVGEHDLHCVLSHHTAVCAGALPRVLAGCCAALPHAGHVTSVYLHVVCAGSCVWGSLGVEEVLCLCSMLVQARTLSQDASLSELSASPSQREDRGRGSASSKQEGRSHRFQGNKKPEKATDLLETLAETAKNSKDDRKSGWRYRRKAQEKRHQKRKSSE